MPVFGKEPSKSWHQPVAVMWKLLFFRGGSPPILAQCHSLSVPKTAPGK